MIAVVVATLAVAAFVATVLATRPVPVVVGLYTSATAGITAMLDPELGDDQKEKVVRATGLQLVVGVWRFAWRIAAAVAAAAVVVLAADLVGAVAGGDTVGMLLRWEYLVGITVLGVVLAWVVRRVRGGGGDSGAVGAAAYGAGDRLVHALAFAGNRVVLGSARVDNRLHRSTVAQVRQAPPVFIVSLARGGTTALLNALHRLPDVATHEYGDMPFVTAPLTWDKLSGDRSGDVSRQQRAHGDGMEIGLDSPEAFDEVLWRASWPQKYRDGRISPWGVDDVTEDGTRLFERHHAKVVHLRRPERSGDGSVRYVSKNNANIGRLVAIDAMFPERSVVVALRRPTAHAASLQRQHENFLTQHQDDPFVRRYMRDIGHLEFGALHQPIGFEGFDPGSLTPEDADYWLTYWIAAFEAVAAYEGDHVVVTQDQLRSHPADTMAALCEHLGLDTHDVDLAAEFRAGQDREDTAPYSPALVERAQAVYDRVAARALSTS